MKFGSVIVDAPLAYSFVDGSDNGTGGIAGVCMVNVLQFGSAQHADAFNPRVYPGLLFVTVPPIIFVEFT